MEHPDLLIHYPLNGLLVVNSPQLFLMMLILKFINRTSDQEHQQIIHGDMFPALHKVTEFEIL